MKGRRVEPDPDGWAPDHLEPGDYVKVEPKRMQDGSPVSEWVARLYPRWLARSPNGYLGDLRAHEVTEHEDGTITVSPSIRITTTEGANRHAVELWHGYLERGIWRNA